jgi:hypothetical protein
MLAEVFKRASHLKTFLEPGRVAVSELLPERA